ncbi:ATP-binding protein [Nostoc sp. 2RC]|uniref:ATP-binding protein n=1 Tax=Nostoc sp. 2RC TaxID=2485484 RepID=UPI0016270C6F|nr:ATP-binding protein [Nostoc sp. 2RC]MBC1237581.1 ATP-binding protein [Nostoc sp. 2RC]
MLASLQQGKSICVTGDVGMGKTHLAKLIQGEINSCYGIYKGDNTKCLQSIAEGLDIDLYEMTDEGERGKALTAKQLKHEISLNLGETVLICDRIHKWPASLKGWLEDLHESGATLLLLGNQRDLEGVLFRVPRLVLPPLDEQQIRTIIWSEAAQLGVQITAPKAAELASRAGGNPLLAQRMVLEMQQGVDSANNQDGGNYRDITPFLMVIVGLIGATRFIGMATGNIQMRILGGLAITVLFSLRSLSMVFPKRNSRR